MQQINAMQGNVESGDFPVLTFWEETYLPWLQQTKKASTLHGYTKLWAAHMQHHFTGQSLQQYSCPQASAWCSKQKQKHQVP
jgi:hypothetical protein